MKKRIVIIIFLCVFFTPTSAFTNEFINRGKQYKKRLTKNFTRINKINIKNKLVNAKSLLIQINKIRTSAPNLYLKNKIIYTSIENWLKKNPNINESYKFGISFFQMKGVDNYGNVKISGYYTPIIKARKTQQDNFIYPIYSMPDNFKKKQLLPKRKEIYNGILDKKYILAYSNSLIDNFIMEIQGSAFIDYEDNQPLKFFSYAGSNKRPYKGIGQILINRGKIEKKNMSMQAIRDWCKKHSEKEVKDLLEENTSFVFFKETKKKQVYGASSVPLVAQTSIAADNRIIKKGSVILLEIPILDENGLFLNKYEIRLVIALDVGGAIKGQHFDVYEGIGKKAEKIAGFYNHYGYAWILNNK